MCVTTTASGIVSADPVAPPVLLCVLALSAAIVFPWGLRTQLWTVAMVALAIAVHFAWLTGPRVALPPSVVLATVTGLAASALIAWELERHREGIARRDHLLRQQARRHQAWIAALPVTLHRTVLQGERIRADVFQRQRRASDRVSDRLLRRHRRGRRAGRSACIRTTASCLSARRRAMLSHGSANFEYRVQHADGTYRWLLTHAVLLSDEQSNPSEVIGSTLDLTERKHAEEELARSELRHRLVTQATNDAIWDWDLRSDDVVRNVAVQTLFGYAADEVGPDVTWWAENIHDEDRQRVLAGLRGVLAGNGQEWRDEYRFRRRDGRYAFVEDRGLRGPRHVGLRPAHDRRHDRRDPAPRSRREIAAQRAALPLVDREGVGLVRHRRPGWHDALRQPIALHVLGYPPQELIGRMAGRLRPP